MLFPARSFSFAEIPLAPHARQNRKGLPSSMPYMGMDWHMFIAVKEELVTVFFEYCGHNLPVESIF